MVADDSTQGFSTRSAGAPRQAARCGAGRHLPSVTLFLCVASCTVGADLWSKAAAFERVAGRPVHLTRKTAGDPTTIPFHKSIELVPHILSLRLTTNTGAVFGLGKGAQVLFVTVSVCAVAMIGRVFWQSQPGAWALHASFGLVLGGALGNLYDRIRYNAVRDILWLLPNTGLWPWIFNVADAALLVGVTGMVLVMWRGDWRQRGDRKDPG